MKKIIIIGMFSILIVLLISISIKCSKLEQENINLKENCSIIDTIKIENESLNKKILFLENDLLVCKHRIDSLKAIKQKVVIETEYVISENLIEGVQKLKENLQWEKY